MPKGKTKQKPPRTQRDDLECKVCGATYSGHIATKYCETCREEKDAAKRPAPEPTGSEMEVEATAPRVPDPDPAYRKQIHVDPDRQRFDGRRRVAGDRSAARRKAADVIAKEDPKEAARKDALRAELIELRRKRDGYAEEVKRLDEQILGVLDRIGLPAESERLAKACFGRFDASDFECTDLCPLRPECEVRAGGAVPPSTVQAPESEREEPRP